MSVIKKTKLNSKGFSHFELGLLIVVIAVIAGVGMFVYNKNNNKSKADSTVADTAAVDNLGDIRNVDNDSIQAPNPGVLAPDVPQPELDSPTASAASQRMARKVTKPNPAYNTEYNINRSGYRLVGNDVTARLNYATATVNVPAISCTNESTGSVSVVTLNTDDNIKMGKYAQAYVYSWCFKGKGYHSVAAALMGSKGDKDNKDKDNLLPIKTGDKVSLEVKRVPGKFVYEFKNLTTKRYNTFTAPCTTKCETRDARWTVSRWNLNDKKVIPLTKSSDRVFSSVKAGPDGWPILGLSSYAMPPWKVVSLYMTDGESRYLSVPSNPLGADGQSFRVQFVNSK